MKPSAAFAAMSFFLLIVLFGCLQPSLPESCAGVAKSKLANCVYVGAVSEQNPFYCYSLSDIEQRKTCLQDAADPAMKKALQRALPSQRDAIFETEDNELPPTPPNVQPKPVPMLPSGSCDSADASEKDSCLVSAAISQSDMSLCGMVFDLKARQMCISDLARKTKNISACDVLEDENDQLLCRGYAKGGE